MQVKDTLLWTYFRLIDMFPTNVSAGDVAWPAACSSDADVAERIEAVAALEEIKQKIAFLIELEAFERSRSSWDVSTGESTDEMRTRYKISQAAWASRFEKSKGRLLRLEDELIRVDWELRQERLERIQAQREEGQAP